MAEDSSAPSLTFRPKDIEDLGKLAALLAAVCYVVGLIAVNLYLYELGISDFTLFRARFVLCGLVAMLPLGLTMLSYLFFSAAVSLFVERKSNHLVSRRIFTLMMVLYGLLPPWAFSMLNYLTKGISYKIWFISVPSLMIMWAIGFLIILLAHVAILAFSIPQRHRNRKSNHSPKKLIIVQRKSVHSVFTREIERELKDDYFENRESLNKVMPFLAAVMVLFATSVLVLELSFFARNVYPSVPEQLGGGKPREVRFLFATSGVMEARRLGIDASADDRLSPTLELLWETEDMYVVHPPAPNQGVVVRIDRALVAAVVTGDIIPLAVPRVASPVATASATP